MFSITISGDHASYFLEMNMLISLKGTWRQTGMGVGRAPSKGPMRGQFVFLMAKFQIVYIGSVSISISRDLTSIAMKGLCLLVL